MKLRSLRSLHRDQRGQIVPLFMLGLVSMVLAVAMILNTGRAVHNRTRVQNAADAAAITQASWAARSLNVISMNNVGLVHMFTVFMVSNAFATTWMDAFKIARKKAKEASIAYGGCMAGTLGLGAPVCNVYKAYKVYMQAIQVELGLIEVRYTAIVRGWPTSLRLISAFGRMSGHIVDEFPRFTWDIAEKMREENGADEVLFFPMSPKGRNDRRYRGTAIPVSEGLPDLFGPMLEICKAAEEGPGRSILGVGDVRVNFAKHGYTRRAGPYVRSRKDPGWILTSTKMSDVDPFWVPLEPPVLDPVFPAPAGGPLTRLWAAQWVPLAVPLFLDLDPDWPTRPSPAGLNLGIMTPLPLLPPKSPLDVQLPFFDEPESNDYARQMRDDWRRTCRIGGEGSRPALLSRPKVFMLTEPEPMAQAMMAPGQGSQKYFVRDPLALMAFAVKREESPIAPNKFENPPGGTYAYAQAHVYNIVSYDLYTQAWGARLEPARFLEDGGKRDEVVQALRREDGFDDLHELFRRIPAEDFRRVSAH